MKPRTITQERAKQFDIQFRARLAEITGEPIPETFKPSLVAVEEGYFRIAGEI